jgi:hypothetical protein
MLITRRDNRLLLIDQVDHGSLTGDFAARWGNEDFERPDPFDSVHIAATYHDEGWRSIDAEPRYNPEERRPLHFLEISLEDHVPLYRSGVEQVLERDRYAGLLVSMHWSGLYRSRWGMQQGTVKHWEADRQRERTPLEVLLDETVAAEEQRWAELKPALVRDGRRSEFETRLWHNFDLLQAFDFFSLYVCVIDLEPVDGEPRPLPPVLKALDREPANALIQNVPTRIGGAAVDIALRPRERGVVAVNPYPFSEDAVRFSVKGRVIADGPYDSAEAAREAVAQAEVVTIECEMTRA